MKARAWLYAALGVSLIALLSACRNEPQWQVTRAACHAAGGRLVIDAAFPGAEYIRWGASLDSSAVCVKVVPLPAEVAP